jgi:hypothetical protein
VDAAVAQGFRPAIPGRRSAEASRDIRVQRALDERTGRARSDAGPDERQDVGPKIGK